MKPETNGTNSTNGASGPATAEEQHESANNGSGSGSNTFHRSASHNCDTFLFSRASTSTLLQSIDSADETTSAASTTARDHAVATTATAAEASAVATSPGSQSSLRRNVSKGNLIADRAESKVLVIYTGGTIGMIRNESGVLEPLPNALVRNIRKYPNMHDDRYAKQKYDSSAAMGQLVLPHVQGEHRRIIYTIAEYDPLLDSSNITITEWTRIAEDIRQAYAYFDGFVILHGTDTLSYTASALSFMLENLGKTVIITGSQIPIFETRTDGKDNLTLALIIAGNYVIPEVCVMFGSRLMRGNRTIKVSTNSLHAFDSPNVPPLAQIGINVDIDYRLIHRPCSVQEFCVHTRLSENVGVLRIFPSITAATVRAFLQPPMEGVVLQTFGSGNIPSNRQDLVRELQLASERGVLIVNCTQCTSGSVDEMYETGQVLQSCGVVSGYDMTPEAALTKLAYVLGKEEWKLETKKKMMDSNLRGEFSSQKAPELQDYDLVDAVARSLRISTPRELAQLGCILFPAMINAAVQSNDIAKLDKLKSYGADLATTNCDQRTALHIACAEGNENVARHLLLNGVSVHVRDRYDRTPLMEALAIDHHALIGLLRKCGAHLSGSARVIGAQLCSIAAHGRVKRMESFRLAGADLSQPDASGRTALHAAAVHGCVEMVAYLLRQGVELNDADLLGMTPLEYARRRADNGQIVQMLEKATAAE